MIRSIVISAGGTGGHISPGIALAEKIVENKEVIKYENLMIYSLKRNQDNPDLRDSPCPVEWHNTPQPNLKFPIFIFPFIYYIIKTIFLFQSKKVDCVIAMGGYSSLPALIYAILFRKKIFLCEQNRIIGKVTRVFMRYADKVAFSFPPVNFSEKISEYKIPGNPLRKKILPDLKKQKPRVVPGKKEKINVLVMGGSQGARQINNMVINAMNNSEISKNFNFRILAGSALYEETKAKPGAPVDILSYSEDMKTHYEWAHLVIARSGAGVISECAIFALPMILVPYPYAADNHQEANADYFLKEGGARVLSQKDENHNDLLTILLEITINREILGEMSEKTKKLSRPDASLDTARFFFDF